MVLSFNNENNSHDVRLMTYFVFIERYLATETTHCTFNTLQIHYTHIDFYGLCSDYELVMSYPSGKDFCAHLHSYTCSMSKCGEVRNQKRAAVPVPPLPHVAQPTEQLE